MQNKLETTQPSTIHHSESSSSTHLEKEGVGLLTLVNELRNLFEKQHTQKIEDLEFKLLEKEDLISQMGLEISKLKAHNEEKDIEIYRIREEINESKRSLEQLVATLSKMQN